MILKCEVKTFFSEVKYLFFAPNKLLLLTTYKYTEAANSKN